MTPKQAEFFQLQKRLLNTWINPQQWPDKLAFCRRVSDLASELHKFATDLGVADLPALDFISSPSFNAVRYQPQSFDKWDEEMIRVHNAAGGTTSNAAVEPVNQPKVTEAEMKVVRRLNESPILLKGPDAYADLNEATGKAALSSLESAGLIHRPRGKKSGYTTTPAGRSLKS